jgi:glycerophosphoryl diester phosphodiesterase
MDLFHRYGISVIAHRGYSGKYPENTLLAFEKAIEIGADYIELDVHRSADGKILVIHDAWTARVGDSSINVETAKWEDIQKISLKMDQKIPLLEDVFKLCKGKIGVQIEIKQPGLAKDVYELIMKYNMKKEVFISSFKHSNLSEMKKMDPEIPIATLEPSTKGWFSALFSQSAFIQNAKKFQADAIHPFYRMISKKLVKWAKENNVKINAWTVDSPQVWDKLIEKGVSGIITNQPENLIAHLKAKQ